MLPDLVREDWQEDDAARGKREATRFENAKDCLAAMQCAQKAQCFRRVRFSARGIAVVGRSFRVR